MNSLTKKARNLEDTLQLIKSFPWGEQRGADIRLTGPSVTIQDEYVNYLKIGLYFNGKFCLYYLDNDNHLYEYHTDKLADLCKIASDFFNQQLDLGTFDKHMFSTGSRSHFDTSWFEYRVSKVKAALNFILIAFLSSVSILGTILFFKMNDAPIFLLFLDIALDVLCLSSFYFLIKIYLKSKDIYLQISSGNSNFQFGGNQESAETYSKKDILRVNIYGASSRGSSWFKIMEIVFTNNSTIILPGLLIDLFSFIAKFPGLGVNYVRETSDVWRIICNYSK